MSTTNGLQLFRSPFERFYGDFDQVCDALLGSRTPQAKQAGTFLPLISVWEEDDSYVVEAEIPGVAPKDVEITLEGRELRIRGERKHEAKETKKHLHREERTYGEFQRMVRFPADVNADGVEAKAQDGVLRITVKKSEALKPRKIQVS